jgi:SAM-dependent methyltransferase
MSMVHDEPPAGTASPDYSATYDPDTDFDAWYTRATAARIRPWLRAGQRILELGCATGLMTSLLLAEGATVKGLERSPDYLARASARGLAGATFVRADVERFEPDEAYDHVLATNLLHELADPHRLLVAAGGWLRPGGLVHVSLQNPASIHRLAARSEGLLGDLGELSERGRAYGTNRLWSLDELAELGRAAGFVVVATAGVMLKPYPNSIMATLPVAVLDGLVCAADVLPANAAINYLVLRNAGGDS